MRNVNPFSLTGEILMVGVKMHGSGAELLAAIFGVRRLDAAFQVTLAGNVRYKAPSSRRTPKLFRVGDREVAFFVAGKQTRQAPWRRYLHLDLMPLAVEIRHPITDGILVTKFQRNLLEDVIHLSSAARIESFAARDTGEFVQDALSFHAESAAD